MHTIKQDQSRKKGCLASTNALRMMATQMQQDLLVFAPALRQLVVQQSRVKMMNHCLVKCRLLRLMRLLQQLFVMSLTAPQTHVPLINRALPVWMSYLAQLLYIVGLFINFLACVW